MTAPSMTTATLDRPAACPQRAPRRVRRAPVRRGWQPKPYDPGTVVSYADTAGNLRTGQVWSAGPVASSVWVLRAHAHTDSSRGHVPTVALDLTGPAGAAIVGLFRALKTMQQPDGSWPGADVVQYLTGTWLPELGINPDGPADTLTATPAPPVCQHRRVNVEFSTTVYAVVQYQDADDQAAGYELTDVVFSDQAISDEPTGPVFCMDCNRWLQTGDEAAQDAIECVAGPLTGWPAGRIGSL